MNLKKDILYIPKGFAHGFLCLTDKCIVSYKTTNYQNKKSEKTINWFDKKLKIPFLLAGGVDTMNVERAIENWKGCF